MQAPEGGQGPTVEGCSPPRVGKAPQQEGCRQPRKGAILCHMQRLHTVYKFADWQPYNREVQSPEGGQGPTAEGYSPPRAHRRGDADAQRWVLMHSRETQSPKGESTHSSWGLTSETWYLHPAGSGRFGLLGLRFSVLKFMQGVVQSRLAGQPLELLK